MGLRWRPSTTVDEFCLLEAVLHPLGPTDNWFRCLEVAHGLRAHDLSLRLRLLLYCLLQVLVLLQVGFSRSIVVFVLGQRPLPSAIQVVSRLQATRVLKVVVDQQVARSRPLLRPRLRVALPALVQEAGDSLRALVLGGLVARLLEILLDHVVLRELGDLPGLGIVFDGRCSLQREVDVASLLLGSFAVLGLVLIQAGVHAGLLALITHLLCVLRHLLVDDLALDVVEAARRCRSIGRFGALGWSSLCS